MAATRNFKLASTLIIVAAMSAFAPNASALGPGGWDNLGERPPAGSGFSSLHGQRVDSMNTESGNLIVGGVFDSINQPSGATPDDDHIAIYDGRTWTTLGAGAGDIGDANATINALEFKDGKIYAGGTFLDAGSVNADRLAVWDTNNPGAGWQAPCGGPTAFSDNVHALLIVGNTLYIGGSFTNAGGDPVADFVTSCDLTTGTLAAITDAGTDFSGSIVSIVQAPNGNIYMGGQFINADGIPEADFVVQYNGGTSWSALGATAAIDTTNVDSLATDTASNLYVGTDDTDIAGIPQADHIARWNGAAWSALGANTAATDGYLPTPSTVQAIAVNGSDVYAAGNWVNADGNPVADRVGRFNTVSNTWSTLGHNGTNTDGAINCTTCQSIAVFHNKIHVGGNLSSAGGDPLADSIACFPLGSTPCIEPAPVVTPPTLPPTTTTPPAATPPTAPKKCKKGQRLRKGKCVKRKRKK